MARRSRTKEHQIDSSPKHDASTSLPPNVRKVFAGPWLPFVLAAIALLVYLPSLHSDFVSDARMEINEGFITSPSNLPKILSLKVLSMHLILSDRPGEMFYLMLNAIFWGKNPVGYHLSSILLHAVNVALLLVLLRRLVAADGMEPGERDFLKVQLALATAVLVFALHPMATESVAEVSFSSSLLVTFFTLVALLAATAFRPDERKTALVAGGVGIICAFAAVLTKESGITIAFLLVVYWWLFRRGKNRKVWFIFLGSTFVVTIGVVLALLHFALSGQLKLDYLGGSFGQIFLIQPQLWIFMMGQLLWPLHLTADYTLADMSLPSTPLALVILVFVVGLQTWLARHSRLGALGVATYWLGLATVSNFLPLFCILADRFYYLPLAGVAMQLAAVFILLLKFRWRYWVAVGAILMTLPLLAFLTVVREAVFANSNALWTDTLQKSPHSSLTYTNWGLALFQQGRLDEAITEFENAETSNPKNSNPADWLGFIAMHRGELDAAVEEFQRALQINPRNDDAHGNLGMALCQLGRFDEGVEQFHEALAIDHENINAHIYLGLALAQQKKPEEALAQFQEALKIDPDSAQAHFELGNVLVQLGERDRAIEQFQTVLQIEPDHMEAHMNLGVGFLHKELFEQAIEQFQLVLKLRPDSSDGHDNLGVALIHKGDVPGAIAQFQEAVRLNPDSESAKINLAKAQGAAKQAPGLK